MKKRFLFLLVGLNLLIVSSISMSLAWFIGTLTLQIENVSIVLDVDADLKISFENNFDTAKDSIAASELSDEETLALRELNPVSSQGSYRSGGWLDSRDSKPSFLQQYKSSGKILPDPVNAKEGYFTKDVYLFSDKRMYVTFDSRNNSETATKPLLIPDYDANNLMVRELENDMVAKRAKEVDEAINEMIESGQISTRSEIEDARVGLEADLLDDVRTKCLNGLNNVTKSVRFSILDYENLAGSPYTIIDPTKTEDSDPVVFGGRLSTSITRDYYDYYYDRTTEEYKEVLYGEVESTTVEDGDFNNLVYLDASDEDIPRGEGEASCFNAGTRRGVRPLDLEALAETVKFSTEKSLTPEQADVSTHPDDETQGYLIQLQPGVPHKVTLSIYLEGWDPDSLDSTQKGSFNLNIKFRLYKQGDIE